MKLPQGMLSSALASVRFPRTLCSVHLESRVESSGTSPPSPRLVRLVSRLGCPSPTQRSAILATAARRWLPPDASPLPPISVAFLPQQCSNLVLEACAVRVRVKDSTRLYSAAWPPHPRPSLSPPSAPPRRTASRKGAQNGSYSEPCNRARRTSGVWRVTERSSGRQGMRPTTSFRLEQARVAMWPADGRQRSGGRVGSGQFPFNVKRAR